MTEEEKVGRLCLPEFSGGLSMCAVCCLRSECHQDNYHSTAVGRIYKLLSCTGPLCFSDEWTTQFGARVHLQIPLMIMKPTEKAEVPTGVIIGSIIAGILLLLAMVAGLWKVSKLHD